MTTVYGIPYGDLGSFTEQLRIEEDFPEEQMPNIQHLRLMRNYQSNFLLIQKAVNNIPCHIDADNISLVIKEFNSQLLGCKNAVNYPGNICSLEQLHHLELQLEVIKVQELRQYCSGFYPLNKAVRRIPRQINIKNVSEVINLFNERVQDAKKIASCNIKIFTKKQISQLEEELRDYDKSLRELWRALPISKKPRYKTIFSMSAWLRDFRNHDLLYKVKRIDLSDLEIVQLPVEILQMRGLEELYLSKNKIAVLPEWISGCTQLKVLDISYNQLKELPERLFRCKTLEVLNISHNNISHNNIEKVLRKIADLTNLTTFLSAGNR